MIQFDSKIDQMLAFNMDNNNNNVFSMYNLINYGFFI